MDQMATVAGLFPDRGSAENAIRALRDAGFAQDQIGVVMRDQPQADEAGSEAVINTTTGAVAGGVAGGTLGAILAATGALVVPGIGPFISGGILATALVGGAAGWLVGGLVGLGIPQEEAEYYQGQVEQGRVLVTVNAAGREDEAHMILRRSGAEQPRQTAPTAANQPVEAIRAPMPGQPLGATGNVAPETLPTDAVYETSATNPRGYATEPVSNKPDSAGDVGSLEAGEPHQRVILPPEFVPNPRAAENYGGADTPPTPPESAGSSMAGSATPSPNDAAPTPSQATPRPDGELAVNPEGTQDSSQGETGIMRDEDIIRQEQQRMQ